MPAETVRLRIGNLAKAVLVSGQAYQDPGRAQRVRLERRRRVRQAGRRGERIRIVLRRRGRAPVIAVDDAGRGMSPDRLRQVARNLFESEKSGDDCTVGEKAIGILALQQLGGRCDIVSRAEDSAETWVLRLERGRATAKLERERRKARQTPGTTASSPRSTSSTTTPVPRPRTSPRKWSECSSAYVVTSRGVAERRQRLPPRR